MNYSEQYAGVLSVQQQIRIDKILAVHHNMPLMLIGNLLGSAPLAIALWNAIHDIRIVIWIMAIGVWTLVRWFHYRKLDAKSARPERIFSQGRGYIAFAFVSGCIWGSAGVFFFHPELTGIFSFLFLTLFAMTSGSMTSLSARPVNYLAYAVPTILPITIYMLVLDDVFFHWMGLAALVYLSLTLMLSFNLHRSLDRALLLKYENRELLQNLRRQTAAAEQANRDKSRFLAAASHDLRQPLHAVNLFAEGLERKLTTEAQAHDLEHMREGLNSLDELFNALLDISRMDAGSITVNQTDFLIGPLIQKLVQQFVPEAENKGLKLTVQGCGQAVHSDPVLLERLMRNLLGNAIRYTEQGGVCIVCQQESKHRLCIRISDTGPGIPKQHHEDVFAEFFQLGNPERDRGKGLGLGLAIVRRLSQLLDVPIEMRSEPGKGTEFEIRAPIGKSVAAVNAVETQPVTDRLKHLRILVVDNETEILDAMRALLEGWQCRFTGAESTRKALQLVEGGLQPDLIVSDYRMPGEMNGCELIQSLRNSLGMVPALLISGDTGTDILRHAKQAGLILLAKPVKPAQLRLTMTRLSACSEVHKHKTALT